MHISFIILSSQIIKKLLRRNTNFLALKTLSNSTTSFQKYIIFTLPIPIITITIIITFYLIIMIIMTII